MMLLAKIVTGLSISLPMLLFGTAVVPLMLEHRAAKDCFNASEHGAFICEIWYDRCRAEGDCNFETYWPPLMRQLEAEWAAKDACLLRALTGGQRRECLYGANL